MRLIDADAYAKKLDADEYYYVKDEYAAGYNDGLFHAEVVAEDFPTVDAIPVKWLEERYPIHDTYGTESYFRKTNAIYEVIKEWAEQVEQQPTVDAVSIRQGKWIPCMEDSRGCADMFQCSECKRYSYYAYGVKRLDYEYCPYCGAKMDGEHETN